MLFFKKEQLIKVEASPFKFEKDIQKLVEQNLEVIFNLKFIDTEVPVEKFRFDTLAYDEENNAFAIIEYKRGTNNSLIDQGYAYLFTLLDRKADLVLLYNKKTNGNKNIDDIDWSQSKIYFISPEFTDYQIAATSFTNIPFVLFEVTKYDNELYFFNEIKKSNKKDKLNIDSPIKEQVDKTIKIYKEEDHLKNINENIVELYNELKEAILEIGKVEIVPKKKYIAFKHHTNFCDLIIKQKFIKIIINMKKGTLKDYEHKTTSCSEKGHWGTGDYEIKISCVDEIEYLLLLLKQSYEKN